MSETETKLFQPLKEF